jgi:hypothetical protein
MQSNWADNKDALFYVNTNFSQFQKGENNYKPKTV